MSTAGTVPFRAHPGAAVDRKPLSRMTDQEVICAALFAGHDTTAVQATRRAALAVRAADPASSARRQSRSTRRAERRRLIQAGLDANAVPTAHRKFAWLSWLLFLVPPPWNAILSAILWTVDQLLAEAGTE